MRRCLKPRDTSSFFMIYRQLTANFVDNKQPEYNNNATREKRVALLYG